MQHGMGVLRWTPRAFWRSTPAELYQAIRGWQLAHGIDPDEGQAEPLTMAELDDLMARFPDEH